MVPQGVGGVNPSSHSNGLTISHTQGHEAKHRIQSFRTFVPLLILTSLDGLEIFAPLRLCVKPNRRALQQEAFSGDALRILDRNAGILLC